MSGWLETAPLFDVEPIVEGWDLFSATCAGSPGCLVGVIW
jgi:hypothetical protein